MSIYHASLIPEKTYHIISRAIGSDMLFIDDENYSFFLQRFNKYISGVASTLAYCLLPNHFHFLIELRTIEEINEYHRRIYPTKPFVNENAPAFISKQFSNLLNSYTKSFNTRYKRKGALFIDKFRRVEIVSNAQYRHTFFYIHRNPQHHGYVEDFKKWRWSSYNNYLLQNSDWLMYQKGIGLFDNIEQFIAFHQQPVELKKNYEIE